MISYILSSLAKKEYMGFSAFAYIRNLLKTGQARLIGVEEFGRVYGDAVHVLERFQNESDKRLRQSGLAFAVLSVLAVSSIFVLPGTKDKHAVSNYDLFSSEMQISLSGKTPVRLRGVSITSLQVGSSDELITYLKKLHLWDISPGTEIPPVIFAKYPANLDQMNVEIKKRIFLHTLLPAAMIALAEVEQEKTALRSILDKLGNHGPDFEFNSGRKEWQTGLLKAEVAFIDAITKKYRAATTGELLSRVEIVPISLIMAQGALESSWGSSRFASQGNNLFGIWTWGEKGLVPARRDAGKRHKLAVYDSILGSIRDYILMLNRLPAYNYLRTIRQQTMDPIKLAEGLLYYSELRGEYVGKVRRIIRLNRLYEYDKHILAENNVFFSAANVSRTTIPHVSKTVL